MLHMVPASLCRECVVLYVRHRVYSVKELAAHGLMLFVVCVEILSRDEIYRCTGLYGRQKVLHS